MKNKLLLYAIISSPLLALYGASPFFIFGVLPLEKSTMVFVTVFFSMVLYWLFNWYLFYKSPIKSKLKKYIASYLFSYASNVFKVILGDDYLRLLQETIMDYIVYPFIMSFVLNTIILIIINSVKNEEEKQIAKLQVAELKLENVKAQKQTLLQQLQPHFLFNALSVLKSLVHENSQAAETYTVKLSNFLRYTVDAQESELIHLNEEIEFVKNYVALQEIRFGDSFEFSWALDPNEQEYKLPVLALQTLVENAFKHNYFTEKNPLRIEVKQENSLLHVINNISSLKLTERNGTGLKNLRKRYSMYGEENITIDQSDKMFSVTIPLLAQ